MRVQPCKSSRGEDSCVGCLVSLVALEGVYGGTVEEVGESGGGPRVVVLRRAERCHQTKWTLGFLHAVARNRPFLLQWNVHLDAAWKILVV